MPNNDSHQHVVKTSAQWNERAVEYWIVPRGCLCIELTPDGKTKIKIGEGNKYYAQLPYITSEADLTQYYTKEEINILFENLNRMAIMSTDEYDDKEELPLDGNKLGDVRFVKSSSPSIKIDPDIYLWNGTKWIFVGYEFKDVDLSKYLKKEEFHELFDPVKEKVDEMYPKMHTHSNKEVLDQITAPFTIPEKEKLAGLENYDDTEIRELIHESSHTHDNKDILDTITSDSLWSQTDRNKFNNLHNYDDGPITERVADLEDKAHTHTNKEFLDTIAMPYQIWSQEDREKFDSLSNPEVFIGTDGQYPGRKGLVPAPTITDIGKFLSSSGHWLSIEGSTDFVGATADTGGVHGLVPAPMAGQNTYFLRGDGTWAEVSGGGGSHYTFREGSTAGSFQVKEDDGEWQTIAIHSVPTLGTNGKILETYLPSYVDDVVEGYYYNGMFYTTSEHTTEIPAETGKIYVDLLSNTTYRWGGTTYVPILNPVDIMRGATASTDGVAGLVPAPAGSQNMFLRGDGTWATVSTTDINARQALDTSNKNYPLLFSYAETSSTTANIDNITRRNNSIYVNPSTGTITATNFAGTLNSMTISGTSGSTYNLNNITKVEASSTNGKIKINDIDTTVYTHPAYTAKTSGLYKVTVDTTGHVSEATAVAKADITALGIPAVEASSTNGKIKINDIDTTVYTHPAYTAKTSGLYKVTVDTTGHVSEATAVAKADITALGIPAQDTWVDMTAATASASGTRGTVQPPAGAQTKYLRGDNTWVDPIDDIGILTLHCTNGTD
jgi:hypothetical protein